MRQLYKCPECKSTKEIVALSPTNYDDFKLGNPWKIMCMHLGCVYMMEQVDNDKD